MEEKTNGIKKLFESDKARKIIVIIGIIGIALILFLQFRELIPIKNGNRGLFGYYLQHGD